MDGIKAKLGKVESGESNKGTSNRALSMNTACGIMQALKFSEITSRTSTASTEIQLDQMQLHLRILRVEKFVIIAIKARAQNTHQLDRAISLLETLGWTVTPLKADEIVFLRLLTEPSDLVLASQLHVLISELA